MPGGYKHRWLERRRHQRLAGSLSKAVDYPKSGQEVDLAKDILTDKQFRVKAKPDFLHALDRQAFYNINGEYYKLPNLLGRLYRRFSKIKFIVPSVTNHVNIWTALCKAWSLAIEDVKVSASTYDRLRVSGATRFDEESRSTFDRLIEGVALRELQEVKEYEETHCILVKNKLDIFLRKHQDRFADRFIERIINEILLSLHNLGLLKVYYMSYPVKYYASTHCDSNVVEGLYKISLLIAWLVLSLSCW